MKKLVNDNINITLSELVEKIQNDHKLIVVYIAKSEMPYYAFFGKQEYGTYAFTRPFVDNNSTYHGSTIRESLQYALNAGKEILVFERDEASKVFKLKP